MKNNNKEVKKRLYYDDILIRVLITGFVGLFALWYYSPNPEALNSTCNMANTKTK